VLVSVRDRGLVTCGVTSFASSVRGVIQSCPFFLDADLAFGPTDHFVPLRLNRGSIGAVFSEWRTYVPLSVFSSNLMAMSVYLVYPAGLLVVRVHRMSHVFSFHRIMHELVVVGLARLNRAFAAARYLCHMESPLYS
jgi:hypothetical protein